MPRNVRNFWITTDAGSRAKPVGTGPIRKGEGFVTEILIRENGDISDRRLTIRGVVLPDGTLEVRADSDEPEFKDQLTSVVLLRGRR